METHPVVGFNRTKVSRASDMPAPPSSRIPEAANLIEHLNELSRLNVDRSQGFVAIAAQGTGHFLRSATYTGVTRKEADSPADE